MCFKTTRQIQIRFSLYVYMYFSLICQKVTKLLSCADLIYSVLAIYVHVYIQSVNLNVRHRSAMACKLHMETNKIGQQWLVGSTRTQSCCGLRLRHVEQEGLGRVIGQSTQIIEMWHQFITFIIYICNKTDDAKYNLD